jgi:hypothetical protein
MISCRAKLHLRSGSYSAKFLERTVRVREVGGSNHLALTKSIPALNLIDAGMLPEVRRKILLMYTEQLLGRIRRLFCYSILHGAVTHTHTQEEESPL